MLNNGTANVPRLHMKANAATANTHRVADRRTNSSAGLADAFEAVCARMSVAQHDAAKRDACGDESQARHAGHHHKRSTGDWDSRRRLAR